jgi:hypothetical protein
VVEVVVTLMYGMAAWMVKPFASEACSAPVVTVTVWEPVAAEALMAISAVALVALMTVTGPVVRLCRRPPRCRVQNWLPWSPAQSACKIP